MKYVIGLVVIAIVVGFVSVQFLLGPSTIEDPKIETPDTTAANEEQPEATVFTGNGTLASLIARNEPIECAVVHTAADTEISGTVFMSEGRMRADMLQTTPGMTEPVLSSMIMTNEIMYSWSEIEGQQYGVKMDLTESADVAPAVDQGPIDTNESVDYTCKKWATVDNSIFVPPSTVLFQDMNALMQTGMEYGTVYNEGEF